MPWLVIKILKRARLSLEICQTTTNSSIDGMSAEKHSNGNANSASAEPVSPITSLQIKQIVNPGGYDSKGSYTVDGSSQDLSLPIFGEIRTQMKFIEISEILDESIRRTFYAAKYSGKVIQELARNASKGWEAEVIWALETIKDEEKEKEKIRLTRNVSTTRQEKKVTGKMIYDGAS